MSELSNDADFSMVQIKIVFRLRFFRGGKAPLAPAYSSTAKPGASQRLNELIEGRVNE